MNFNRKEDVTDGKELALQALSGKATPRVPFGLLVWGFDYTWQVAGLEPWQLSVASDETWHQAHLALYERHHPDVLWYLGNGRGEKEPELIEETDTSWIFRESNSGSVYKMDKTGLGLEMIERSPKRGEPTPELMTREDIDKYIDPDVGFSSSFISGLQRLQNELGDRCLVLPNCITAYISACYALGFERAMRCMLDDEGFFFYLCERYRQKEKVLMQQLADIGCPAVLCADAWASCDIISPAMFEKFCLPYHNSITEAAHNAGLKLILWNEGDISPILNLEATVACDGFSWEQPRKTFNIQVADVRGVFGNSRCLLGNFDSEHLLASGDEQAIRNGVWEQIRQSGQGAPFIMCTGSPIPSDVKPEYVDMMIKATDEFTW